MLNSIQYGSSIIFGELAVSYLQQKYPNFDFQKNSKKIELFNFYGLIFGAVGGFAICALEHFTNARMSVSIINIIGAILWLTYFAFSPKLLVFGTIVHYLQGVLMGYYACIAPILMTSTSTDDTVGMLGCMNQFGILLGMIIFHIIQGYSNFQIIIIIGAILNLISAGLIWITPKTNKHEKKLEYFTNKNNLKRLLIGVMIMIFQQLCINPYLDNLTEIMRNTGIYLDGSLQEVLTSSTQLVSVLIASFNMDGVGPRLMWVLSTCGMLISQILFLVSQVLDKSKYGWFQALCVFLYMLSFGHGLGPIPWFLCYELFPKEIRMEGQAVITFVNMIFSFFIFQLYGLLKQCLKEFEIMIIFAFVTICAILYGYFFIPKKIELSSENLTLI